MSVAGWNFYDASHTSLLLCYDSLKDTAQAILGEMWYVGGEDVFMPHESSVWLFAEMVHKNSRPCRRPRPHHCKQSELIR